LGKGNGTFQPAVNYSMSNNPQVANNPGNVTLGRLRSNGPLDIVMSDYGTSNVTVLLGNGDGTFGAPIHVNAGAGKNPVAIADFNNDGTPDILVADQSNDTVNLLAGNGNGTFQAPVQLATGATPFAMAVGQFDSHNLPEVAVLGAAETITVLLNDSGGALLVRTASANGAGQIVGTGLTSNGTRQTFLLTPDEAGIRRVVDLGVFTGVSGVNDDQTQTRTPLDTAAVDQFFAAGGRADQRLWLVYYSLRPRHTAVNANWEDFSGYM
jgi:hypothetical protein